MKRLLLGLCAFAFLALVGAQSLHVHADANAESCGACAIGHSATRTAPQAAPAPAPRITTAPVAEFTDTTPSVVHVSETRARAPPAA